MKIISFKHSANLGDLIAALCGIKSVCEKQEAKSIIYQQINVPATYFNNDFHPTQINGKQVMMNKEMFDMVKPLIMSQDYVHDFLLYEGQDVICDLDVYRQRVFVNMPVSPIQTWAMLAYPNLAADISKAWIDVEYTNRNFEHWVHNRDKVIICFTDRYRNNFMDYYFLKKYEKDLLFAGTEKEHTQFCEKWKLSFDRLQVNDFLELAQVLKASKFLLSNQTFIWNLAEAMKHPRIVELFAEAPNCIPFVGERSYGYFHKEAVEYYFDELYNLK